MRSGRMPASSAATIPAPGPFEAALAEMATPLLLLDAGGTVTFANDHAAILFAGAVTVGSSLATLLAAPEEGTDRGAERLGRSALAEALTTRRPTRNDSLSKADASSRRRSHPSPPAASPSPSTTSPSICAARPWPGWSRSPVCATASSCTTA